MEDTNSQQFAKELSQAIKKARQTQNGPNPIKKIKVKFRKSANLGLSTGKGTPGKRGATTGSKTGENKAAGGEQNKKDAAVENEEKPIGGRESIEEQAGEGNEGEEDGNQEGEEGQDGDGGEEGEDEKEEGEEDEGGEQDEEQGEEAGEKNEKGASEESEREKDEVEGGEKKGEGEGGEAKKEAEGREEKNENEKSPEEINTQPITSSGDEGATQKAINSQQRKSSEAKGTESSQPEVSEGEGESKPKGAEIVSEDSANLSSPFEMKGWTTEALKWAWEDKYSFFFGSYGVSLLYINFHFIMSYLASSPSFCKFGDEKSKNISITDSEFGRIIIMFLADILIIILISALLYTGYATLPWLVRKCIENDGNWIGDACVAGAEIIPSVFK